MTVRIAHGKSVLAGSLFELREAVRSGVWAVLLLIAIIGTIC